MTQEFLKNTVIKGRGDKVVITFDFSSTPEFATDGLDNFTEITLTLCGEEYSTVSNPANLYIEDNSTLILSIGTLTTLEDGSYTPIIVGFNGQNYIDGKELNSTCRNRLGKPVIVC